MTITKRSPQLDQQPEIWEKDLYRVWDYATQIRERDGSAAAAALTQRILAAATIETKGPQTNDNPR